LLMGNPDATQRGLTGNVNGKLQRERKLVAETERQTGMGHAGFSFVTKGSLIAARRSVF